MNLKKQAQNKTLKNFLLFVLPAVGIITFGWSYLNFAVSHIINLNSSNSNLILWIWLFFLFAAFSLGWLMRYFCTVTGFESYIAKMSKEQREIVIEQLKEANKQALEDIKERSKK